MGFVFVIDPSKLSIDNKTIVDNAAIEILRNKKITLEMSYIDTDPVNLSKKPTLIFIHGNSASKKIFDEHLKKYSNQYRIIAMDLLGHGESTKICSLGNLSMQEKETVGAAIYNPHALIAAVKQMLESQGVSQAHVLGWSLGGHIAYGLATENPKLIDSITTIGSPTVQFSLEGFKKGFQDFFTKTLVPLWTTDPKHYNDAGANEIARTMGFSDLKSSDKFMCEDLKTTDPLFRKYLFLNLDNYSSPALEGELFAITTKLPLCLMVGENDKGIRPEFLDIVKGKLINKNSRMLVIKDGMHALFKSHPKEYYEHFESFLASVIVVKENPEVSWTPLHSSIVIKPSDTPLHDKNKNDIFTNKL